MNKDTTHFVKHSFKEEIIIPLAALTDNIDFLLCKGEKTIITRDNVACDLVEMEDKNVLDMEKDIMRLYNMDGWSFLKIWHNSEKSMDSLFFIRMKLKKR